MKGIVLAGGKGTRLLPFTKVINKHLLPVVNRPMIYFPIRTLRDLGCDDILLVTGGEHIGDFAELLGDGSEYGVQLTYRVQKEAGGIADALKCAEGFIHADDPQQIVPVILGDNYFAPSEPIEVPKEEAIVISRVKNAQRFGVFDPVEYNVVEKPTKPVSQLAVTGLYFYKPRTILTVPNRLIPSARGELEITDVNNHILKNGADVIRFKGYWSDMGTHDSLLAVANHYAGNQ